MGRGLISCGPEEHVGGWQQETCCVTYSVGDAGEEKSQVKGGEGGSNPVQEAASLFPGRKDSLFS